MKLEAVRTDIPGYGPVVFVMPIIQDDFSDAVKSALAIRKAATLSGRCACGATWTLPSRAEQRRAIRERAMSRVEMVHEADCAAADHRCSGHWGRPA